MLCQVLILMLIRQIISLVLAFIGFSLACRALQDNVVEYFSQNVINGKWLDISELRLHSKNSQSRARALAPLNKLIDYAEAFSNRSTTNKTSPKLLFLKGKSYKKEILELSKTKKISFQEYQSITDDFGKILYINSINVLNINNE